MIKYNWHFKLPFQRWISTHPDHQCRDRTCKSRSIVTQLITKVAPMKIAKTWSISNLREKVTFQNLSSVKIQKAKLDFKIKCINRPFNISNMAAFLNNSYHSLILLRIICKRTHKMKANWSINKLIIISNCRIRWMKCLNLCHLGQISHLLNFSLLLL